jgi:hypothetical protein
MTATPNATETHVTARRSALARARALREPLVNRHILGGRQLQGEASDLPAEAASICSDERHAGALLVSPLGRDGWRGHLLPPLLDDRCQFPRQLHLLVLALQNDFQVGYAVVESSDGSVVVLNEVLSARQHEAALLEDGLLRQAADFVRELQRAQPVGDVPLGLCR